jgi:hypothetical protein
LVLRKLRTNQRNKGTDRKKQRNNLEKTYFGLSIENNRQPKIDDQTNNTATQHMRNDGGILKQPIAIASCTKRATERRRKIGALTNVLQAKTTTTAQNDKRTKLPKQKNRNRQMPIFENEPLGAAAAKRRRAKVHRC